VEQREMITIKPMDKSDALALLQEKLGQWAAHIIQRRPRYSVQ
jgi:hypothetical protein